MTQDVIEKYIGWIKDNTFVQEIERGGPLSVSTPFLDRHNDHVEIYVVKQGNNFKLTDDGFTLGDLEMSGMDVRSTNKREKIFRTVLNGFGVKIGDDNDLFVNANMNNLGQKKHYLIQAILAVNDMFCLSQETVYSLFKEDVELYFRQHDLIFSKDIKLSGKTGFDHNIDFLFSGSPAKPERLVKTINTPKKDQVMSALFAFNDIKEMREESTKNYVIYNDSEMRVAPDIISALDNYKIEHIAWSEKERCLTEFAMS